MDVLVVYDIATLSTADQRRLNQVAKICEGFGQRVQYSVFECRVSDAGYERLVGQLALTIDHARDSVLLYRIDGGFNGHRTVLGSYSPHPPGTPWIL